MLQPTRLTILVVDDQPPMRRFIVKLLAGRGYELLEAGHASEALALATGRKIDLLITDVVMPGTSGPELVAALASTGYKAPVLMMSGHGAGELAQNGGRTPFLEKPFSPGALIATVDALLTGEGEPVSLCDPA